MKEILIIGWLLCIVTVHAQTKVPPLWINIRISQIQLEIEGRLEPSKYDDVMDQGYYDGVQFFSNFFMDEDSICVSQSILFRTLSTTWVTSLIIDQMGFHLSDSTLVKEIPDGFLVAEIASVDVVGDKGTESCLQAVIELFNLPIVKPK